MQNLNCHFDERIVDVYQDLVFLELEKLRKKGYDFSSPDTLLSMEEIKRHVDNLDILNELLHKELIVKYDDNKFRTAHVDLIWRVINLRAFPYSPPRALEFIVSYDREVIGSFDDHEIAELYSIKPMDRHGKEALDIVIKALKDTYPGLSHFQLTALKQLLQPGKSRHIGIIAPTASGKTLVFMIPILVKAVKEVIKGFRSTIAILTYPRKALAKDQIEKLIELIHKVNKELSRRYGKKKYITVGFDYGDIERRPPKEKKPLLNIKCPEHGCNEILYLLPPNGVVCCNKNHKLHYIYAYKEKVWKEKPQIYITNIWTLYHRLMNTKTLRVLREAIYIVFDEAHVYKGYLGGHVYYIIKLLEKLLYKNESMFIYSSATIPYPEEFLEKLSGRKVKIIDHKVITEEYYKNKGIKPRYRLAIRVYLLPNPNQHVETLTEETILPVTLWCHKHNLKAITFIDSIAGISTIYNYVNETILGIRKGKEVLDHIDVKKVNDVYSWMSLLPLKVRNLFKNDIQKWLTEEFRNSISVHYGMLPKDKRSEIENKFKLGIYKMLLATSTLELGIDIGDIAVIIQHKLPREPEEFIQRVGRAGRSNECYRISLSFVNLQNSPIATLYFYDDKLRSKLEFVESLEPLKIGLSSESILSQHLISLLLHKYALKKDINLTIDNYNLYDLSSIVDELSNELSNIDNYVKDADFINNYNKSIYNTAKKKVKEFITLIKDLLKYAIQESIKIDDKKIEKLSDFRYIVKERLEEIDGLVRSINQIVKHAAIPKELSDEIASIHNILNEIKEFIKDYRDKAYKPLNKAFRGQLEPFKNLKHNCESIINELSERGDKISDKIEKYIKRLREALRRKYVYTLARVKYRDDLRRLLENLNKLSSSLSGVINNLLDLESIVYEICDEDIKLLRVYNVYRMLKKLENSRELNVLEVIEELSQGVGILKFSRILEYPSVKIMLRR